MSSPSRGYLFDTAVQRPISVLMALLTLLVVGAMAYSQLPLQLAPGGIVAEEISVSIPVSDSTPEEVMETVAEPAEEMIRTIAGITRIVSNSSGDSCFIRVSYESTVDGDAVYADLRDRMERLLPSLPEGSDRYRIFRFNIETDIPIMSMAVSFDDDVESPDTLLENLVKPRIESVDGVARVQIQGAMNKRLEILLDPQKVEAYGVNLQTLIDRLSSDNLVEPAGIVHDADKRFLVRVSSRFQSVEEIESYRINDSLLLGDIAKVEYRRSLAGLARVDGKLCRVLDVAKVAEANAVDTCTRVDEMLAELQKDPRLAQFQFLAFFSQGRLIEASLSSLQQTCAWGGLFAVLILYLFMRRVPLTLVVAASIPLSLLIAVVVIYFSGGTLNLFSLTGLTLGIGMLIDNSIVIAENIFRHRELGDTPQQAARRGTAEVALAVTLATLTTVVVFLPLIFLGGESNIRVVLSEVGLPVCYSLMASLLVALFFIPLATVYVKERPLREARGPLMLRVQQAYARALRWTLRYRFRAGLCSFLVFLTVVPMSQAMKQSGQNEEKIQRSFVRVDMPKYFGLREADETLEAARKALDPHRGDLGIETVACWYGAQRGTIMCVLEPTVATTSKEFQARLREILPALAGVDYRYSNDDDSDEKETSILANGRDPRVLYSLLDQVGALVEKEPGVLEVVTPAQDGRDEIVVEIAREQAQRFAVNPVMVTRLVSWSLRGAPLPDFESEEREVPLWIRYEGSDVDNIGDLYQIPVYSNSGEKVPLSTIASFSVGKSLRPIRRENGKVTARLRIVSERDADVFALQRRVQAYFNQLQVPEGYELSVFGNAERLQEDMRDIQQAMLLGLILIFVVMGVLFESVALPFSVLFSIPFMFVGSIGLVFILGEVISGPAMIGYVILLGIVVNNAIVLIDCINRFREQGKKRAVAIVEAGQARLRPILMTACTTICGLTPLVVIRQMGEGFDYRPVAVIVMGGLAVSTFFTLLVVPLFYTVFEDLSLALRSGLRRSPGAIDPVANSEKIDEE